MHGRFVLLLSLVLVAPAARADDRAACAAASGEEAIEACGQLIMSATGRDLADAHRHRCTAWLRNGELELAIAGCSEAVRLNPNDVDAYNARGNALRQKGDHAGALADYDSAARLNPKRAVTFNNRGLVFADRRDYARAIAEYGEAIRLDPTFAAAFTNRGLAYERRGDRTSARADFEKALATPEQDSSGQWARDAARDRLAVVTQPAPPPRAKSAAVPAGPQGVRRGILGSTDSRQRLALVIGNGDYPNADPPPNQPTKHARALAGELRLRGFDVALGENLTKSAMERAITAFKSKIKPGSAVLLFYSGYGIQTGRQTYLIPVDARIWTERDVLRDGVAIEQLLAELDAQGAAIKLVILDASRRNPFERNFRSGSAGLGAIAAPAGSLVLSAAGLGKIVNESTGEHSLFVSELLKEMRAPAATAEEVFSYTRIGVSRASESEQVPWLASSLAENFSFAQAPRAGR